ncbi:MAG TPA: single-stranded-DNA-specific exonuclease RecJ [Verrucomicrobiae bacterium]|nr:single-stranded-DNA-specific exonuclease RecJ [Verrucomicrobiae bacterium]
MRYRWVIPPPQPLLAESLARDLSITPLLSQCLLNRNIDNPEDANRFLEPRLKYLSDPYLLPNMAEGVERLFFARANAESVVIFGDYDVDGVTSTALLTEVMRGLGWNVQFYLPHRMDEGYGLSQIAVENCLKKFPAKLILAVDCGSSSAAVIDWLNTQGVDVIVLDHHQIGASVPNARALINPHHGDQRHLRELCSVGLAFKLAHALLKRGRDLGIAEAFQIDLKLFLDLVALGTVADLVPLTGENRILVSRGMMQLAESKRTGLIALKEIAQCKQAVGPKEIGFQLAPRLNAAGRLEHAMEALELLLSTDPEVCTSVAQRLDARNRERQDIEKRTVKEILEKISFDPAQDFLIVQGHPSWHIGVVGIVASRVLQEFYRPTIILGGDEDHLRGSGRSVEGFDLAAALRECSDLLINHGGHAMAAGLSIRPENVDPFRARMNDIARAKLQSEQLIPPLRLDAETTLADLTFGQIRELEKIEHCGIGNPPVRLLLRNVHQPRPLQRVGADKRHVKMWIGDGQVTREAVWWNAGELALPVGQFDLAFCPELSEYQDLFTVQLRVLDWRPAQ